MSSKIRHLILTASAAAASATATPAAAQGFQDIEALDRRVASALGAGIGEPGGAARPIDRRLKLGACPGDVIVGAVVMSAVTVRCQQIGWRIRVPVMNSPAETRTASARPAAAPAKAEKIIRRGDPVSLVVITGGFTVARQGVADQDGAPGDRIRVRTEPRTPPIIGEVLPDGRVAMPGFK